MQFVIFHGAFGSPENNWLPELKEKLESLDQDVITPRFAVDNWEDITKAGPDKSSRNQNLKNWLKVFDKVYKSFGKGKRRLCFVGHSLGPLFILHVVDKYNIKLDCAIFISPFLNKLGRAWQIDHVNKTFYKADFNYEKLKKLIPVSYTLYSDNDPYVAKQYSLDFAGKLDSSTIFVRKAGHMNIEVNLNEFPLVFELCKTRLNLSLYQRYLAHRRELYTIDYTKGKSEEVIYLQPGEVFDEGRFHFRNLRREGFCTFFTAVSFWDTQAKYYQEARRAARRVKQFTRVFVVNKISDLKKKLLLKQIKLDIEAGIKAYLVMYKDIKELNCEPDFGIWDNDYLCIVKIDKNSQVEVKLSSRKSDIKKAQEWKKEILKRATRIYNSSKDIKKFIKDNASK